MTPGLPCLEKWALQLNAHFIETKRLLFIVEVKHESCKIKKKKKQAIFEWVMRYLP